MLLVETATGRNMDGKLRIEESVAQTEDGKLAWERRGRSGTYFYTSRRDENGRVRKEYFGNGKRAQREAQRLADAKARQQAEKLAIQREQQRSAQAKQLTRELEQLSTLLFEANLLASGYWRGRDYRRWRRRNGIRRQ